MDGEGEDDQEIHGGERNAKSWFEKKGCTRSNKMERRCPDDSYVKHPATSIDGNKAGLKLKLSPSSNLRLCDIVFQI